MYLTQKTVVVLRKHDVILKHFAFACSINSVMITNKYY